MAASADPPFASPQSWRRGCCPSASGGAKKQTCATPTASVALAGLWERRLLDESERWRDGDGDGLPADPWVNGTEVRCQRTRERCPVCRKVVLRVSKQRWVPWQMTFHVSCFLARLEVGEPRRFQSHS